MGRSDLENDKPQVAPLDQDAELAELAALIESGDTSPEALERIAYLLGQTDRTTL
jgi:hypothetical protein